MEKIVEITIMDAGSSPQNFYTSSLTYKGMTYVVAQRGRYHAQVVGTEGSINKDEALDTVSIIADALCTNDWACRKVFWMLAVKRGIHKIFPFFHGK